MPLRAATLDAELWDAARRAFVLANAKRLAVRAVALTLDRLMEAEAQLELWGGSGTAGQMRWQQHTRASRRHAVLPPSSMPSIASAPATAAGPS